MRTHAPWYGKLEGKPFNSELKYGSLLWFITSVYSESTPGWTVFAILEYFDMKPG